MKVVQMPHVHRYQMVVGSNLFPLTNTKNNFVFKIINQVFKSYRFL